MRATARVVAVAQAGRTRLATLRSQAPLLLRRTGGLAGHCVRVHLVGGAAGPLGGDRLRLELEVGPGASLCVRTVAASVALPGATGAASRLEVTAEVGAGGRLAWLPEPLVAARGCRHTTTCRVALDAGAHLAWRDELVFGRHGETPGDATVGLAVSYQGRALHRQELAIGPQAAGWDSPAVLGRAGATGSLLRVEPAWASGPPEPVLLGPTATLTPLAGPAMVATAAGPDAATVRHLLDAAAGRPAHAGMPTAAGAPPAGHCVIHG